VRCLTPIAAGFAPTVYTVPISRAKPLAAEAETKTTAILLSVRHFYYIVIFTKTVAYLWAFAIFGIIST